MLGLRLHLGQEGVDVSGGRVEYVGRQLKPNLNKLKLLNYPKTRMKTFISSEALSLFGAVKIAFPQKPDGYTDINKYRVASLLSKTSFM